MSTEAQYRGMAASALQGRENAENDLAAAAHGRVAAGFSSAARNLLIADRKRAEAAQLRQLATRHLTRGNRILAQHLRMRADDRVREASYLEGLAAEHAATAEAHQEDVRDATDLRRRRAPKAEEAPAAKAPVEKSVDATEDPRPAEVKPAGDRGDARPGPKK